MTWESAWSEGRTGWDAGASAPALEEHLAGMERPGPKSRALVPGCGSGYDVFALARAGFKAHGVDIAPTAAQRFEMLRQQEHLGPAQAMIHTGNFFEAEGLGRFDVIFDYTFLCAIEPDRRPDWVARMIELLKEDGELWTLIFPVDPDDPTPSTSEDDGPPYRMHPAVVAELLEPRFEKVELRAPAASHPGREGKEFFARWRLA